MENNLFKNLLKNTNLNTYNNIRNVSFCSLLYGIVNPLVVSMIDFSVFEGLLIVYILLNNAFFLTTSVVDGEKYTKEILEITELYNILIDNYVILNNTFELKKTIEIYSMFDFMLYKGYLSKDGKFNFGISDIDDINSLLGVNVVTGNAVCRHISTMLNDIYNKLNINSCTCSSYLDENVSMIVLLEKTINFLKEQLKLAINDEERQEIQKLIIDSEELKNKIKPKFYFLKRKSANHMINLVSKDNVGYIIDPTNEHIYKKDSDITNIDKDILKSYLISSEQTIIKLTKERGNYDQKREILLLPNSTQEEDKELIEKTKILCTNNIDLLDKFKTDNSDLYYEITDKIVKVKKKKILRK